MRRDWIVKYRGFLGQWKSSVCHHNDGHVITPLCASTGWRTLRIIADMSCGLWERVMCEWSVLTNVPLCWGTPIMGEAVPGWGQGACGKSVLSSQFCCEPRAALKNKVFVKKINQVPYIFICYIVRGDISQCLKSFCSCLNRMQLASRGWGRPCCYRVYRAQVSPTAEIVRPKISIVSGLKRPDLEGTTNLSVSLPQGFRWSQNSTQPQEKV